MSLVEYQDKFKRLVVNRAGGRPSPHKICMLLAVLDMARAGALPRNEIHFAPPLLERYGRFFSAVKSQGDHPNPYFPFFHLASKLAGGGESFWRLKPVAGREAVLAAMSTARSAADITSNVRYAELDQELYRLLLDPRSLDALAETISTHWLDRGLQDLRTVAASCDEISRYERQLRTGGSSAISVSEPLPPAYVRDPAFRRLVTELYDYRCAATGVRVLLPNGDAMVEAAHIHPFSEEADDDPRNGLALSPNMHWAMDKLLIAPGPDLKWHVSPFLDDRIADLESFVRLAGRPVLLPNERRYVPKRESLEWRLEKLKRPDMALLESLTQQQH